MSRPGLGEVSEVFGPDVELVPPGDPARLAQAIAAALDDPAATRAAAARLQDRIRTRFSQDAMVEGVLAAYREAIAAKIA